MKYCFYLLLLVAIVSCKKNNSEPKVTPTESNYFPSTTNSEWETKSLSSLGWNQNEVQSLKDFLIQKNTKSFMILVDGRIVMEEYFNGHTSSTNWEWNSAGKTLVATTIGIAQKEGLLNINNKVSDYIGSAWTSMPLEKENLISLRHLLTMTSGNDDSKQYVIKSNVTYVADAGARWAYSNVFQKLTDVVATSSNKSFEAYFNERNGRIVEFWKNLYHLQEYNQKYGSFRTHGFAQRKMEQ